MNASKENKKEACPALPCVTLAKTHMSPGLSFLLYCNDRVG